MFLLTKLFQIRDDSNPDEEKPFLDHLDDLRVMLFKMILVLVVTTIGCYVFRNNLMDVIRHPVEEVWTVSQKSSLKKLDPKPSLETWEKAVQISNDAIGLNDEQRAHFQKFAGTNDPDFAFHVESAYHFRIALAIDDLKEREKYVSSIPNLSPKQIRQLKLLIKGNPNAELDAKGKMVLMQSLNPTEGFMLSVKLAFFAALVLSFPLLLYFLLQFVLPGLHNHEQRALYPALSVGFLLFLTGVLFAYFVILPNVLDFFYKYSMDMGIQNDWRIGYYISFATQFVLIFGLAFELPVIVMTLVKLGVHSCDMMRTTRSYAILAIVVIAAIITPTPDALTLGLLAGPMYILYEICIWLAYFLDKKEKAKEAEQEEASLAEKAPKISAAAHIVAQEDDEGEEGEEGEEDFPEEADFASSEDEDWDGEDEDDEEPYAGPSPEEEDLYSQAPVDPPEPSPDDEEEEKT